MDKINAQQEANQSYYPYIQRFSLDLRNKQRISLSNKDCLDGKVYFVDTGLEAMTRERIARIRKYTGEDEEFF